jgi:chitin-binding protein
MKVKSLLVCSTAAALLGLLAGGASGHGLVEDPPSRNWFCGAITKPDEVMNGVAEFPVCGDAFNFDFTGGYNFMSVLTHTQGRSVVGPRTNVCGFNSETWSGGATVWDQPINWPTSNITSGPRTFTWNISWGPHFSDTQEFRYWITKPGFAFQVGRPLSFDDFEEQPFCVLSYNDANPTGNPAVVADPANARFRTTCTVPARTGRHVIYAEWGRNHFTFERFHGCMDVVFQGGGTPLDARIALTPNVTELTGAGSITLDGRGSQGIGLTYKWSVDSVNPSLYRIENPEQSVARLVITDSQVADVATISLVVTGQGGTDNATVKLLHRPSVVSPWLDLGPLVVEPRTLATGDRLSLRTVQNGGQDVFYPTSPVLISAANAGPSAWPLALAQAVNAQTSTIRIGVLNAQNQINPVANATTNRVYALITANVTGSFLQVVGTPGCQVAYQVASQWQNGFQTNLTITNQSNIPVVGYSLSWSLGSAESFGSGWNATYATAGSTVTASNTAGHWNGTIRASGGTVTFGFQGVKGPSPTAIPTDFRLNGNPCTTAGTSGAAAPRSTGAAAGRTASPLALALLLFALFAAPGAWLVRTRMQRAKLIASRAPGAATPY